MRVFSIIVLQWIIIIQIVIILPRAGKHMKQNHPSECQYTRLELLTTRSIDITTNDKYVKAQQSLYTYQSSLVILNWFY